MSNHKLLILVVLLMAGILMATSSANAYTRAGTDITNVASAVYVDQTGQQFTTPSNQVITTVQEICGMDITPSGSAPSYAHQQSAAPGQVVYYQYTLTNAGNDLNDFYVSLANGSNTNATGFSLSNAAIYLDTNNNGLIDAGEDTTTYVTDVPGDYNAPNNQVSLIVSYTVPVTATSGQLIEIDIRGYAAAGDTVSGQACNDSVNYHLTTVSEEAIVTANKNVNVADASSGDTLVYSLYGSNIGNQSTGFDSIHVDTGSDGTADAFYYGVIITDPLPTRDDADLTSEPFPIVRVDNNTQYTPAAGSILYWVGTTTPAATDTLSDATDGSWPDGSTGMWFDDRTNAETWAASQGAGYFIRGIGFVTGTTSSGSGTLIAGQNWDFEFDVRIPVDLTASRSPIRNQGQVEYRLDDQSEANQPTNPVQTRLNGPGYEKVSVSIGPAGLPTAHDFGTNASEDTVVINTIAGGETQNIYLTVRNNGLQDDIINILRFGANGSQKPGSFTVSFFDGATPLGNVDGDLNRDVGTVAPGDTAMIRVQVYVDANVDAGTDSTIVIYAQSSINPADTSYAPGFSTNNPNLETTLTADPTQGSTPSTQYLQVADATGFQVGQFINVGNEITRISAVINAATDTLEVAPLTSATNGDVVTAVIGAVNRTTIIFRNVTGAAVEYVNRLYTYGGDAVATDENAYTFQGPDPDSSTVVNIPLTVRNPANRADTYTLSESLFPATWNVTYYEDADCQGDLDASELSAISDIGPVAGGDTACVYAVVDFPATTAFGTYPTYFTATSTNKTDIDSTVRDSIRIPRNPNLLLEPDRSNSGRPNTQVSYIHDLINLGNTIIPGADTSQTNSYFTISSSRGWSYALYQEDPDTADQWDALPFAGGQWDLLYTVPIGGSWRIRVVAFIPSNAPDGVSDVATITAVGQGDATGASDPAVDITTVIDASMDVRKAVRNLGPSSYADGDTTYNQTATVNQGVPQDTLKYYVNFYNTAATALDTVYIYDDIPANTTYVPNSARFEIGSGGTDTIEYSNDNGATWTAAANDPTVTDIRWIWNSAANGRLNSGAQGRVSYKVTID